MMMNPAPTHGYIRRLSSSERKHLQALRDPGKTYIGGDLGVLYRLEKVGLVAPRTDPLFPHFVAYSITAAGVAALNKGGAR